MKQTSVSEEHSVGATKRRYVHLNVTHLRVPTRHACSVQRQRERTGEATPFTKFGRESGAVKDTSCPVLMW